MAARTQFVLSQKQHSSFIFKDYIKITTEIKQRRVIEDTFKINKIITTGFIFVLKLRHHQNHKS